MAFSVYMSLSRYYGKTSQPYTMVCKPYGLGCILGLPP